MLALLVPLLALTSDVPLANPGFEDGADGWSLPENYSVDGTVSRSGAASLKVVNTDPEVYRLASQAVPFEAGACYEYSVWVKTDGVEGDESGATACLEWSGPDGWLGGSYAQGVKGTADWTLIRSISGPIPPEATSCRLTLYLRKGMTGAAWFDDASMREHFPEPLTVRLASPRYRGRFPAFTADAEARVVVDVAERLEGGVGPDDLEIRLSIQGPDQAEVFSVSGRAARHGEYVCPLSDLAPGEYRLRLELAPVEGGDVLSVHESPLTAVAPVTPEPPVYIDERGRTIVNGEPFFPLGLYDGPAKPEDLAVMAEAGFNCVMPYGSYGGSLQDMRERLDRAEAVGMKMIFSIKDFYAGTQWFPGSVAGWTDEDAMTEGVVTAMRDHPALLAWYLNDELPVEYVPRLRERYEKVRALDPDHPCWSVLYQVGQMGEYVGTADVLGSDPYPVGRAPLSMAGDWTRRTVSAMGGSGSVWQVPQAHDWANYAKEEERRPPTLDDLRCMTYQCLAEGAMGLIYYSFYDLKRDALGFEARWADMRAIAGEVNALIPFLLSDEPRPDLGLASTDPDRVSAAAWSSDGEILILAANGSDAEPLTVTFRVPDGCAANVLYGRASEVQESLVTLGPEESVALLVSAR